MYQAPTPPAPPVAGYQLGHCLGSGGFAAVYRGRSLELDRDVAFKIAHRNTQDVAKRFQREAEALQRVGPPSSPELYATGQIEDGRPFLAMELLAGQPVSRLLEALPTFPPLSWVNQIAVSCLRCIMAAHSHGIVHRDIKPENMLACGEPETVRLIDFGLVRGEGFTDPELTNTGHILGTPEYSSPEQLRGERDIGPATDVYAFGVFLYELLTLRPPFVGLLPEVEHGHLALRPPRPSMIAPLPEQLDALVLACLEKDPAHRPKLDERFIRAFNRACEREDPSDRSGLSQVSVGPGRSTFRTDGKKPVVLLSVTTSAGASHVSERIVCQGGLMVRYTGNRYLAAFTGLEVSDPVAAAHRVATDLMLDYGASSAIHLVSLRVRKQKWKQIAVYGRAIENPETWLPKSEWTGVVLSTDVRSAIREGTLLPVPDQPDFFYWDRDSDESKVKRPALVGRDRELELLREAVTTCITKNVPTLCTVIADGGMGKSRLAREFLEHVDAATNAQHAFLHCQRRFSAQGNEATRDLLRLGLRYDRDRPPGDPRALCLNRLGHEIGELCWRSVAYTLGWTSEAPKQRIEEDVARAIFEGLIRRAQDAPFVLILDDAQWVEDIVLKALEQCTATDRAVPLLIACFAHPQFEENRPPSNRAKNAVRLVLDPLSKEDSVQFARSLLSDVHRAPLEALERLASWAGGSPFMMEELVRGLRQEGLIRRQEGTDFCFLAAEELSRLPPSPANQWLVERELSAMPPELADLTRLCGVLGTEVTLAEVQAVQSGLERDVNSPDPLIAASFGLPALVQRRVLIGQNERYVFRAPALQEAVYDLVDADAKKKMHHHALQFWRTNVIAPGFDRLDHIAYHARGAGDISTARHCFLALASAARRRTWFLQAEEYYGSALALMSDEHGINYIDTLIARGVVRRHLSKYEAALSDFEIAQNLAKSTGHIPQFVEALIYEATTHDFREVYTKASERIKQAVELPAEILPPRIRASVDNAVGAQLFREAKYTESADTLAMSVTVAEALGETEIQVGSMLLLAGALWVNGRKHEADIVQREIFRIAEEAKDFFHLTVAFSNSSQMLMADGKSEEALAMAERCLELSIDHGYDTFETTARKDLIWLHIRRGENEEALRQGKAAFERAGLRYGGNVPPTISLAYAFALLVAGDAEQASSILTTREFVEEDLEPPSLMVLQAMQLHLGQPTRTDWASVLRTSSSLDTSLFSPADIYWLHARTQKKMGAEAEARATYLEAIHFAADPAQVLLLQNELKGLTPRAPNL